MYLTLISFRFFQFSYLESLLIRMFFIFNYTLFFIWYFDDDKQ